MAIGTVLGSITAGGFVYIEAAHLIPELQRNPSLRGLLTPASFIASGMALMAFVAAAQS
jgi:zinc transporter ZupT